MTESMGTYTQLARAFVPKAFDKVGQNVGKRLRVYTLHNSKKAETAD